ncbi:MAG: hypothetical protein ACE5GA_02710 [Candidatus Zixiibacteriota bacterium]
MSVLKGITRMSAMKVRALGLSAVAVTFLATGEIAGQPAEVKIALSNVLTVEDCLFGLDAMAPPFNTLTYTISARSDSLQVAAAIGFVIYSPDNSISTVQVDGISMLGDWGPPTGYWTFSGGLLNTNLDGVLPEFLLTGGVQGVLLGGFQEPEFVDIFSFQVRPDVTSGTLCVDSSFFHPSGDWLMVPGGPPVWHGGGGDLSKGGARPDAFCVTIADFFPGEGPCFGFIGACPAALNVRAGDTVVYSFAGGFDPDSGAPPVVYEVSTDGSGAVSVDSTGKVTYMADGADIGQFITITGSATTTGSFTICDTLDTITCECATVVTTLEPANCCGIAGDADHGGAVNIADVTFLIARLFSGGGEPFCANEASANGDASVNISDITFLIARIFADGPAPVCGTVVP